MNKKVLFAICAIVLIVGATTFIVVELAVIRNEMTTIKDTQELSLNESSLTIASEPSSSSLSLNATGTLEIEPTLNIDGVSLNESHLSSKEEDSPIISAEDNSTQLMGASIDVPFTPFLVIHAPVPCKKGFRYSATKNGCERII